MTNAREKRPDFIQRTGTDLEEENRRRRENKMGKVRWIRTGPCKNLFLVAGAKGQGSRVKGCNMPSKDRRKKYVEYEKSMLTRRTRATTKMNTRIP